MFAVYACSHPHLHPCYNAIMLRHQLRHIGARRIGDRLRLYELSPDDGDRNSLNILHS